MSELVVQGGYGVAGGSRDWGHDIPFLSQKGVCKRRLADVRLADDCEVRQLRMFVLVRVFCRHELDDLVEQFACTASVRS